MEVVTCSDESKDNFHSSTLQCTVSASFSSFFGIFYCLNQYLFQQQQAAGKKAKKL